MKTRLRSRVVRLEELTSMARWSGPQPARREVHRDARTPIGRGASQVPLIGRIPAGEPQPAEQSTEDVFTLPRQFVGDGVLFLLQVSGNSMIDAAIADGDWVVVRQQPTAENGEIVAAMVDGEATIKTLVLTGDEVWLMPCNSNFDPISGCNATILGKVVTVLRRL
jgi:repressor LexA